LKEILTLPHIHQYQRTFDKQLDHGEKKSIKIAKSDKLSEEKKSKSANYIIRLKTDLKKPNESQLEDEQSVSIDLDDGPTISHSDQAVRKSIYYAFMARIN
jgi:glutamyl/glutaminyl-tRNA synthetase